jgi:uncharacterized protein
MKFKNLFSFPKPLIACIHLMPLPGSPRYAGAMKPVIDAAMKEATIFTKHGVDGIIIENFRDNPFYPDKIPPETIASMTVVTTEIKRIFPGPVGINALRNDASAAISIAAATEVQFIRVNVHVGAAVTDQGIIQGRAFETLRLRKALDPRILIFADAGVKHASPLGTRTLSEEVQDLAMRGMADAIILTGTNTGSVANPNEINNAKQITHLPVLVGSGITKENLELFYPIADGMIIGSYFKSEGQAENEVNEERVRTLMALYTNLKKKQNYRQDK